MQHAANAQNGRIGHHAQQHDADELHLLDVVGGAGDEGCGGKILDLRIGEADNAGEGLPAQVAADGGGHPGGQEAHRDGHGHHQQSQAQHLAAYAVKVAHLHIVGNTLRLVFQLHQQHGLTFEVLHQGIIQTGKSTGQLLLDSTPENTLLLVEGTFELHFALFRIPDEKNTVFLIGPWTVGPRTQSARKWVRRYLGEAGEAAVQEYYNGVKILEASDFYGALRVVVDTMFGCTVPVQELKEFLPFQFHPDTRYFHEPEFQKEIPVTMLEQRYESENRILDAVARGDEEAAIEAMHQHSRFTYGGRFEGTLYQQKNKMIVLNTLLRKAIEPSKVHPYYIDAISSKYSRIIEEANEVPNEMMWQMTRDYCAYVRRYSLKEYSPAVQKVMNYVNLNVAEPLTLKSLAAMCFISPSYLSALFKQETGSTLIDYINTQRVNRAAQLLVQNNHTIAAVAEEVGILDVNYFTKIFKKTLGVTPTRYRREHKEK